MNGTPNIDCAAFYRERDQRTTQMIGVLPSTERPIVVRIDDAAARCSAGQLLLLALLNQLARVHRRIHVVLKDSAIPLALRVPFASDTLGRTIESTLTSIDPCGAFSVAPLLPASIVTGSAIQVSIGATTPDGADWYLGADRAFASLSDAPVPVVADITSMRGAALAACLGAAAVLRTQLGRPTRTRIVSAWNFLEGERGGAGPGELSPVAVGRVLMVGAGAVGSALAFWLQAMGVDSRGWVVPDADIVKVHNTNRGLLFSPADAGWPHGDGRRKCDIVAAALGDATPIPHWYDEWNERAATQYDVVMALANERSVRAQLSQLNAVVTLQATTSSAWQSQLHRHVLGHDDCVQCRTGALAALPLACSAGNVSAQNDQAQNDAALPFLSAASGLLLGIALQRLMHGQLISSSHNRWAWDFDSVHDFAVRPGTCRCHVGCGYVLDPEARQMVNQRTRWAHLDRAHVVARA
jgi:hypothetical protein